MVGVVGCGRVLQKLKEPSSGPMEPDSHRRRRAAHHGGGVLDVEVFPGDQLKGFLIAGSEAQQERGEGDRTGDLIGVVGLDRGNPGRSRGPHPRVEMTSAGGAAQLVRQNTAGGRVEPRHRRVGHGVQPAPGGEKSFGGDIP